MIELSDIKHHLIRSGHRREIVEKITAAVNELYYKTELSIIESYEAIIQALYKIRADWKKDVSELEYYNKFKKTIRG